MKKMRFSMILTCLCLAIAICLPACGGGTAATTTTKSTSAPAQTTASGPKTLKSIDASPSGIEVRLKATGQINVMATYTDGTKKDVTSQSTYKSSDEKVATVSASGLITALYEDKCEITITYSEGGVTQTDTVTVKTYSGFLGPSN